MRSLQLSSGMQDAVSLKRASVLWVDLISQLKSVDVELQVPPHAGHECGEVLQGRAGRCSGVQFAF